MKESYREDLASNSGLELYADDGNVMGVATTEEVWGHTQTRGEVWGHTQTHCCGKEWGKEWGHTQTHCCEM